MTYTNKDTIFVQIASYRDPELQYTLQDLFKKAKKPENIFIGICHQYDIKKGADKNLFKVEFPRKNQLRIDEVDYRKSQGCCWARNRVQKLHKDEKWTLMIDSHMRFEEGWDDTLVTSINDLRNNDKNAVISNINSPYYQDEKKDDRLVRTSLCFDGKDEIISHGGLMWNTISSKGPYISAMYSGGFLFCDAALINEIKYDKFLYFYGEEITYSVRLWTSGYNIYNLNRRILNHLYKDNIIEKESYKHLLENNDNLSSNFHKADFSSQFSILDKLSLIRAKSILMTKRSKDKEALKDLDQYYLGKERSLKDYQRFAGVDFRKKRVRQRSKYGVFEEWQEVCSKQLIKKAFKNG